MVDPDEPSLIAWELKDGTYTETAHVSGEETFHAGLPYDVTITPAQLVEP